MQRISTSFLQALPAPSPFFLLAALLSAALTLGEASQAAAEGRWAKAMAGFAAQDASDPYPQGGVVFVGSSSVRLWDLAAGFPDVAPTPLNRGFGGSTIPDAIEHFDLLIKKHQPRCVVFYSGDNDIAAGHKAERVAADFETFAAKLRKELPECRLIVMPPKPSPSRWKRVEVYREASAAIEAHCQSTPNCEFVDVWPAMTDDDGLPLPEIFRNDKLHMNEQGYALWNELLGPHIAPRE
ncbi:GDSL-like Lipase/Acylhydrolase [Pseudobythopirellula maris]|uniref:GDSL-like Lipase/Acylhydrolase n=1 Tax=Pseudobythopirellula maris TaxID=2527991 RepID=A0A5C5ZMP5_9BACT|nr:GDSL-type esterase/lipase family protein [Pseudobythopirellula maris]TWT88440.1 GDSL-like Lipase/Acylhydrolase [Pseudobythopirellula maris]